ncbi:sigma-54-dependent transcriptional regulator [Maridesulfovibrio salexigens]|uniref:Two component, sigma54 specific, transcriptional regulator, Fis family n=1 Tax=Maridesulfovibrio salexigens (strain ATCC 14822 / DSM 2638 / NCIMB 8403 / VKM B-1763) TaxID=526222 RepID=C6BU16_MARSD|nr:sigma-54 dependent transcriptional regulator [Maridesulfovibrio salexigens]ACS81725.1 two component, sigma54 specific, transcriptional regulator, Fis family [Maridesulfovibrio salexigens DSM 2638]
MSKNILIVDDEDGIRYSLRGILEDEGFDVSEAESGEKALEHLNEDQPDLVFLDIWLPGMDGLEVLDRIKKEWDWLPVVMISGHGNIETAVSAIKKGAFDFIEKPLSLEKVVITAEKAVEFSRLQSENKALRTRIAAEQPARLTGQSESIDSMREVIGQVAPTDAWVLITGENGTGKEIVARSIHSQSQRADKPLVAVNCAAIPEELIESELFGHEKGAFTGAEKAQEGKFELADNGTLFLDEIGDMSLKTQAKILRILQEQRFERVGGRKTINVDVRVIAATNKDLFQEIKNGNFREDLYYRLKVFPLEVPPLRDRNKDIPLLIDEFITSLNRQHGFKPLTFTEPALNILTEYSWPGNVRELKNFVERMLIMFGGKEVGPDKLPPEIANGPRIEKPETDQEQLPLPLPEGEVDFKKARADFEAQFLEAKLREYKGNVSKLAEAVGLERSSLYRKLKAYEIQVD